MECENCEEDHEGEYGSGRFCGAICARGYSTKAKRKEINEKVSKKLKGRNIGNSCGGDHKKLMFHCLEARKKRKKKLKETLPFHEWPLGYIREHIFEKQKGG